MADETVEDVLLRAAARLAEKINVPHDPGFEPSLDHMPTRYVLDLYPYTLPLAVNYLQAGLAMSPQPWQGNRWQDLRQKRFTTLLTAAQLPWRLLGGFYEYDVVEQIMQRQSQLLTWGQEQSIDASQQDTNTVLHVLANLEGVQRSLTPRHGTPLDVGTLRDGLARFTSAFCKF